MYPPGASDGSSHEQLPDETHVLPDPGNLSSKGKSIILEGVTKEPDHSEHTFRAAKIWKGGYSNEVVALKALRIYHRDSRVKRTKSVSMLPSFEGVRCSLAF